MSITAERKQALVNEYATKAGDTGSPEVQVAILTERIANLTEHFKTHAQGQPFPSRPPEDGLAAPFAARLRQGQGRAALSLAHRAPRHPPLTPPRGARGAPAALADRGRQSRPLSNRPPRRRRPSCRSRQTPAGPDGLGRQAVAPAASIQS